MSRIVIHEINIVNHMSVIIGPVSVRTFAGAATQLSRFTYRLTCATLAAVGRSRGSAGKLADPMAATRKKSKPASPKSTPAAIPGEAPRAATRSPVRPPPADSPRGKGSVQWTFLTNHSHVLVLLARNPSVVLREVAQQVGITERAVQRIIADLEAGGFVVREKVGRQNHYQIQAGRPLRHPIEAHRTIGELLTLLNTSLGQSTGERSRRS